LGDNCIVFENITASNGNLMVANSPCAIILIMPM
jgi:hypothetical protein